MDNVIMLDFGTAESTSFRVKTIHAVHAFHRLARSDDSAPGIDLCARSTL